MRAAKRSAVADVFSAAADGDLPGAVGVIRLCEPCELHLVLWFSNDGLLNFGRIGQTINRADLVGIFAAARPYSVARSGRLLRILISLPWQLPEIHCERSESNQLADFGRRLKTTTPTEHQLGGIRLLSGAKSESFLEGKRIAEGRNKAEKTAAGRR